MVERKPFESRLIIAPRGTGKTLLGRHLVRNAERLLIIDPLRDRNYADMGLIINSPKVLTSALARFPQFRLVYRPNRLRNPAEFDLIIRAALACKNMVVLIDEISLFKNNPRSPDISASFETFVVMGRHKQIDLICIAQRPAQVPNILFAESRLLVGPVRETNDIRYIRNLGNLSKESIKKIVNLPPLETNGKIFNLTFYDSYDNMEVKYTVNLEDNNHAIDTQET